jgi:feruloyl esterase
MWPKNSVGLMSALLLVASLAFQDLQAHELTDQEQQCADLQRMRNVTIIYADGQDQDHCYARGLINGSITFHIFLPSAWNGRLVHLGDGGADGDLDSSPTLVQQGYAVVNSNTGHDTGAEQSAYAFRNERAARDFSYWAVHVSTTATKSVVQHYYGKPHEYAYHFGCSTGGRQALLAAQLFPYDFNGIVAGAPAHRQFARMAHRLNVEQHLFRDNFAANLAFDADGDGRQEDLGKLDLLADIVIAACDASDGIKDGILEPELCDFDVDRDLQPYQCGENENDGSCFTDAQLESIKLLYQGSKNRAGDLVYPGAPLGSEKQWSGVFIPHSGNDFTPYILRSASAVIGYSFYKDDPGLIPPDLSDTQYQLDRDAALPEWGWWNFDINDVGSNRMSDQAPMMRGDDPDLDRFFFRQDGKLLMYHGWADAVIPPEPSLEYRQAVIDHLFDGDTTRASDYLQLYMAPGVAHCRGGPGPDRADYLGVLRRWVEEGETPTSISAQHFSNGELDNERVLCPYPKRAVFTGRPESVNDPAAWRQQNFSCR